MVKNRISRLCTNNPLRDTHPPKHPIPRWGEKQINTAKNMLYIAWVVMVSGHNIKKISFGSCNF